MIRILPLVLYLAGDCLAHTGHGAPLVHAHDWEWAYWPLGIVAAAAAWVIWRVK